MADSNKSSKRFVPCDFAGFKIFKYIFRSQKKHKKGGSKVNDDPSNGPNNAPSEQSVAGTINVNNMDLAKLKKAIDEMQSVKVRLKFIMKAYLVGRLEFDIEWYKLVWGVVLG